MRMKIFASLAVMLIASQAQGASRFVPLGTFPGGNDSRGVDISADGSWVAGTSYGVFGGEGRSETFRWHADLGMLRLSGVPIDPNFPDAYPGSSLGISGDGSVLYGEYQGASGTPFYKWTEAFGFEALFPSPPNLQINDVSHDGSRWIINPGNNVERLAISGNGEVVVGWSLSPFGGQEAYRLYIGECACEVRQWLGDLPTGSYRSMANGTTYNGQIVVGGSSTLADDGTGRFLDITKPFWWSEQQGINALGDWFQGNATAVSNTGQAILGQGGPAYVSWVDFRWTPGSGMVGIAELMEAQGIDLEADGWAIQGIYAMSANGRFFAGTGTNPDGRNEAFLLELDIPGDFDANGPVDGADLLLWQRQGADADTLADWLGNYWSPLTPLVEAQAGAVVPEPTSMMLALAVAAAMLHRRQPL